MLIYNWKINKNVIFLAAFLSVFALESTMYSSFIYGGNLKYYTFLSIISPFYFIKAPMLYFFIRGISKDNFLIKWTDIFHLIPFIVHSVNNLPYLLSPIEVKYDIAAHIIQNYNSYRDLNFSFIYPPIWNEIARSVQFLIYIVLSLFTIGKVNKQSSELSGQLKFQHKYTIFRMRLLLYLILSIAILHNVINCFFYYGYHHANFQQSTSLLLYFAMIVYFSIPGFVVLNPKFLYGLPHLETKHISAAQFESSRKINPKKSDNQENLIRSSDEYFIVLSQKIIDFIDIDKPYLNPDFQVSSICNVLGVPANHVQYCLNELMQTRFIILKNEKRVDFAKSLLLEKYTEISIEEISSLSGFSSVSTFYSTFKDVTGFSPVQWVKMNNQLKK
jgi:AraC-like DNA-binding protein